jgi:glucose-1-phosphate cytidylyltransferase
VRALILCGGRGIRAWPATADVPKPMVEIGDRPLLHHVMDIYARQGVTEFVLAAGYRRDVITEYIPKFPSEWAVDVVDTGDDADTGDRVIACLDRMGEAFFLTYGDGVGDVDLKALVAHHRAHGGAATVTVVPLPSQYGTLEVAADDRVVQFQEKPVLADHLINAGFFVVDAVAFDGAAGGSLERDILPALSHRQQLFVYRHNGFWRSMDTHKDITELQELATREGMPWLPRHGATEPGSPARESSSPAHPASSAHT